MQEERTELGDLYATLLDIKAEARSQTKLLEEVVRLARSLKTDSLAPTKEEMESWGIGQD